MKAKKSGYSQQTAAAKAGVSARSARRIESGTHCPQRGRPRDWSTRQDPLDGLWETELQPMLEQEPRLEALSLFEVLQERYPPIATMTNSEPFNAGFLNRRRPMGGQRR